MFWNEIPNVFIFCEMARNGIPNFFIFPGMDGLGQNYKRFALSENGNPIQVVTEERVVVYLPEGGLSDIWRKTIGVLVVDDEEQGEGALLADGEEDMREQKRWCVEKRRTICALTKGQESQLKVVGNEK